MDSNHSCDAQATDAFSKIQAEMQTQPGDKALPQSVEAIEVRIIAEAPARIRIEWTNGHISEYSQRYLRGFCPCAQCQGHERVGWNFVAHDPSWVLGVHPVGHYAIALFFSDGHQTGIYPWDLLKALCPCEACQAKAGDEHPIRWMPKDG